jgi:hypothetical protein
VSSHDQRPEADLQGTKKTDVRSLSGRTIGLCPLGAKAAFGAFCPIDRQELEFVDSYQHLLPEASRGFDRLKAMFARR